MATLGGPALPVIVQNGGERQGGAAIPVTVVSDGRAVQGGPATPIYIATGGPQQGGPALPVVAAPYGQRSAGGDAVPAYIVGGGYLPSVYESKIIALGPIALWPLDEASGTTAFDRSGNGRNGAYTAVTLGAAGIGDGGTAASFDGATSFCNVYSASLAGAFNGQEGSVIAWGQTSAWADATIRRLVLFQADANNRVIITRPVANNEIDFSYVAGGTSKTVGITSFSPAAFFAAALTWSKSADQAKAFMNGTQVGSTLTGLGTFVGALNSATTLIGANTQVPANVWNGQIAQVALFNRVLSPAEVASAARLA